MLENAQYKIELVDDWLRVHRELMEKEAAFTELAVRAASGEVPQEELDQQREKLMGLRALCTAIYEKAFPKAREQARR
jgi:hypothetical protein